MPKTLTPAQARAALASSAQLADVRELAEWEVERVEGSVLVPLSGFPDSLSPLDPSRPVLTFCKAGMRSATAAQRLEARGFRDVSIVAGGLDAWKASGLPVVHGQGAAWSIERQVRLVAGSLTLAGAVLGHLVHPGFFGLCAFVGAGLTFAGLTNRCGMAHILLRMPWNRRPNSSC